MLLSLVGLPPDLSKAYFTGLTRPATPRVKISSEGGPVILIVVDAMRPDHLTPYGYGRDTTPRLKAVADDGVLLTNYFVNGNWTRPSTASLLTGLLPARHAVERDQDRLAEQYVTLGEILEQNGVKTGAVVGNGNAGSAFGLSRGFSFYADTVKHWRGLPSADQVVELAVPFVRAHAAERFFLMLFFVDPHDPYHAPAPYEDMYVRDPSVKLIRSPHWEVGRPSAAEIERLQATYDGALNYTDTAVGRFLDELKTLGIYDKATLMITADHGEAFGEHGVFLHAHHLFEEIVRAPLIIKAPLMSERGSYNHYLFQTVDLMPTIIRAFGAPVPDYLPGVDIFRHLARPERVDIDNRFVTCEFHNFGISRRMIRTYRSKVIYGDPTDHDQFMATVGKQRLLPSVSFTEEQVQMFDIAADPFERHNLFDKTTGAPGPRWWHLLGIVKRHRQVEAAGGLPHVVDNLNLDPETRQDLKALGYIQ
ncbi:MAG: sulfatase [Deltaproteobacteria bacterium]|nr:sulfatase [Deltaproteobacteria bacterium]